MMDWLLTKLDAFWRSGCGHLPQDVVNLSNAREHTERCWWMGTLSTVGVLLTVSVPMWARIIAALCILVAIIFEAELLITEIKQHTASEWWRVVKFCFRCDSLTQAEIDQRQVGGPLDGLTDLFWKALTGFSLIVCIVINITGAL